MVVLEDVVELLLDVEAAVVLVLGGVDVEESVVDSSPDVVGATVVTPMSDVVVVGVAVSSSSPPDTTATVMSNTSMHATPMPIAGAENDRRGTA